VAFLSEFNIRSLQGWLQTKCWHGNRRKSGQISMDATEATKMLMQLMWIWQWRSRRFEYSAIVSRINRSAYRINRSAQ
jgi:hypothetical protein